MWPFLAASGVVFYGVNVLQDKLVSTPEAKKDPKNPYGKENAGSDHVATIATVAYYVVPFSQHLKVALRTRPAHDHDGEHLRGEISQRVPKVGESTQITSNARRRCAMIALAYLI